MSTQLKIFDARAPFKNLGGENLLQFIWQFQYFNHASLSTTSGDSLQVVHAGLLNKDQGPDFLNAKIRIADTLLVGCVEVHVKTSDWKKHAHEGDKAYNNVILHVVFEHDQPVNNIPVLELQPLIAVSLLEKYDRLLNSAAFIPCDKSISKVKPLVWLSWKERLLTERLTKKTNYIFDLLNECNHHWEQVFWWMLARNFGIRVNAEAFEAIARSIPVNVLAKHKQQLIQLEALLLGQAGLLEENFLEDYPQLLQREFRFLKKKYQLQTVPLSLHFLRMRPGNFPTIRLAQLAALIRQSSHLFSRVIESENIQEITEMLQVTANDYWHYHYKFDKPSNFRMKKVGDTMVANLLINTIIPIVFAFGAYNKNQKLKDKALSWLQTLNPEVNQVNKGFNQLGISSASAYDTQALLQLKNEYCLQKKCLSCAVGNAILKSGNEPSGDQDQLPQSTRTSISG